MGNVSLEDIDKLFKSNLKNTEANLKKEMERHKEEILQDTEEKILKLKKEIEELKKRLERTEAKENRKILIFRGITETKESKRDEIANLAGIFGDLGCDSLDLESMVIYATRLGENKEKRILKVECNTVMDKIKICKWREELRQRKITISRDYSREERMEYGAFKDIQRNLKKKFGLNTKIVGNRIEIYQVKYNLEDAQKYANDLLTKEGHESLSSPEAIVNGKRVKSKQRQKEGGKKIKEMERAESRRQRSPNTSLMDAKEQSSQGSSQ